MRPTLNQVLLHQVPATPWRNGGGRTHELLAWPTLDAWQLRISVAVIDCDGAFSAYPGVARCFAVLAGAGVRLHFAQSVQSLEVGSPVLQFDGADAPGCKLIDGPTQDLNLMCPHSAGQADMAAADDQHWHSAAPLRACYSHTAASLHTGAAAPLALPYHASP